MVQMKQAFALPDDAGDDGEAHGARRHSRQLVEDRHRNRQRLLAGDQHDGALHAQRCATWYARRVSSARRASKHCRDAVGSVARRQEYRQHASVIPSFSHHADAVTHTSGRYRYETVRRRTLLPLLPLGQSVHVITGVGPPAQLQRADDAAVERQEGDVQRRALLDDSHEGFQSPLTGHRSCQVSLQMNAESSPCR